MSENATSTDFPGRHAQLYAHDTAHGAPTLQQLYDNTQTGNYTYDPGHGRSAFQGLLNQEYHDWVHASSLEQLMRPPNETKLGLTMPADSALDPTYLAPAHLVLPPTDPYHGRLRPDPLVSTGRLWARAIDDGRSWHY
jgi:hypothetical protein